MHGLYLWVGFGLFIFIKRIKWLLNWRLYVAFFITLLCVLPIVYWNVINNFITYKFHAERVTHTSLQWDMLVQEIVGELAYQNPVVFVLIITSIIAGIKRKILFTGTTNTWLICMSIPMIALFWSIALFNPTLPHWSGPGYLPLYFFIAIYLEHISHKLYPLAIKIAGGFVVVILFVGVLAVQFAPMNFGSHQANNYGEFCPTLDISGWKDFSSNFNTLVQQDMATKQMPANAPIIVGKWFPAGHLEFYTSSVTGLRILGIGNLADVHKFAWLDKERKPLAIGDAAYCIVPSNIPFNVAEAYGQYFTTIEPPVTINQMRSGKVVRYFYVYRLKGCKTVPTAIL